MYFGGFLKAMFKPNKILSVLYFLANLVIIFLLFGWFSFFELGTEYDFYLNGLIGLGINFVFMLVALSPLGEAWVRHQEKVVALQRTGETEWLFQIFDETYAAAMTQDPRIGDKIKLYYVNSQNINAFAIGLRSIAVTDGLLRLGRDEIKGTLAHEFAHISHRDSCLSLGIWVTNCILCVFMFIFNIAIFILSWILGIVSDDLGRVTHFIGAVILNFIFGLWSKIGMLLNNATSRKNEFAADNFAVHCGQEFAYGLANTLNTIDPMKTKMNIASLLYSTHPNTADRIEAVRSESAALYGA